jgi:protein TonB
MTHVSKPAWAVALAGSLVLHLVAFIGMVSPDAAPSDVGGAGREAPVWGVPGSLFDVDGDDTSQATQASPAPLEATRAPLREPAEADPVEAQTRSAADADTAPETPTEPSTMVEAVDVPAAEPAEADPVEPQPTQTLAAGAVALAVPVETVEPSRPDVPEIEAKVPPPIPQPNPRRAERRAAAPPAATPRRQNAGTGRATGNSSARAAPGEAEVANYSGRVLSHLQRRKRYPRAAASRRLNGDVGLRFTIDRSGRVTAARVTRSSGHQVFDQEVLAMVQRANPFPAIPANFDRSSMSFSVTIRFAPR